MNVLILVDIQNDFLPGGNLAVPLGDEVIPVAQKLSPLFDLVVATQDWHPNDHESFASQHDEFNPGDIIYWHGVKQTLWPDHCVQGPHGAELADGLIVPSVRKLLTIRKGMHKEVDSYSAFYDQHLKPTGLGDILLKLGAENIYVLGLATDYCVKFTALSAVNLGFKVHLVEDGCRGVNLRDGDVKSAIHAMESYGVVITNSCHLIMYNPVSGR